MPRRKQVLATDEVYHAFNRSVAGEEILNSKLYLDRSLDVINYYRFPQILRYSKFINLPLKEKKNYDEKMLKQKPLVEIYCFALMPNHFHFLLKQIKDKGISTFISNFQNSFAKYFNFKNNRHGALFENPFKAKWVETDEEFVHISRYIHLNPVTSFLIEIGQLAIYPWTSLPCYIQDNIKCFVKIDELAKMFPSKKDHLQFVKDQADYQRKLNLVKKLAIDKVEKHQGFRKFS